LLQHHQGCINRGVREAFPANDKPMTYAAGYVTHRVRLRYEFV
jgi:hypothetical protein